MGEAQDVEQVAQYYRAARVGTPAGFRQTHYGRLEFVATEVRDLDLKADQVTLRKSPRFGGSAFFISTGQNCHSPTGQSRLIVPTPAMLAEEERQRQKQDEEVRQAQAFAEALHRMHEESLRQRDHWIRARCLEPECGHFGAVRLRRGTSADALISRLYCSQCGSKRLEAVEWSPNETEDS